MPARVFISYSRMGAGDAAREMEAVLRSAIGDDGVFRDETDLLAGQIFPRALFEAAINAELMVCFIDEYFLGSAFCLRELEIGLQVHRTAVESHDTRTPLVLILPTAHTHQVVDQLPPDLAHVHWPKVGDTTRATMLVLDLLEHFKGRTLGSRLTPQLRDSLQEGLLSIATLTARQQPHQDQLVHGLPAMPSGGFFGRSQLMTQLLGRLQSPEQGKRACLVAPGGGGKSRIALEFAWRYGPRHFPGGILWIDGAQEETRDQQFHELLTRLEPNVPSLADLKNAGTDVARRLQTALENRRASGQILWIVDGIPEPSAGGRTPALEYWAPTGSAPVSLLATSRIDLQ
ncbi:MAG: toll/interleukin-1 receptor domain-containing protein, partial [bacterium]